MKIKYFSIIELSVKKMAKRFPVVVYVIVLFSFISFLTYSYFSLGDDTYIYLRYARNILELNEISFNPGYPSYGFTSPLWLGLIVLLGKLSINLESIPTILSFSIGLFSIFIWNSISKKILDDKLFVIASLLLVAFDSNLLKHSFLGMEATLAYLLSSILIYFFQKNNIAKDDAIILGGVVGLFHLTRPESLIISLIIVSSFILQKRIKLFPLLLLTLSSFIVSLIWYVIAFNNFNSILTSTFSAKGGGFGFGTKFVGHLITSIQLIFVAYIIHFLFILFAYIKKSIDQSAMILIGLIVIPIVFYSVTLNREIIYSRYFTIFSPFIIFYSLYGLKILYVRRRYKFILTGISLLLLASVMTGILKKNLYLENEQVEDKIVEWVIINTNKNDKIIRSRIGKIGFKTDREIIDPIGLVNPEIINFIISVR
jgi:hypothetical protein